MTEERLPELARIRMCCAGCRVVTWHGREVRPAADWRLLETVYTCEGCGYVERRPSWRTTPLPRRIAVGDLAKDADAYFAHFGGDD